MEGHHLDKQILRERDEVNEGTHSDVETIFEIVFFNETYSVQSGQLLCYFSHREVHKAVVVFLFSGCLPSILLISGLLLERFTAVL